MYWLIVWAALSVGVFLGFVLAALSPAQAARMGDALYHAGEMLQSGDFEYVSGGFIVQDLGHGVVNFKGDLSLRAVEDE